MHIMIVSGEASGDMRAASLVRAIQSLQPEATFSGIGGDHCRESGVKIITDITELAVIGFSEVLRNLPRIKRVFDLAVAYAEKTRPDAVILVDYPGFNLRLARTLKARGFKIIYYVSPQVWAWKESRVHLIKKVVDRMMVLFPFEKEFYAKHNYTADLVGHPILDELRPNKDRNTFIKELNLDPRKRIIGLLPGSRKQEITHLLPCMIEAAGLIQKKHSDVQFLVLQAKNITPSLFETLFQKSSVPLTVTQDYTNGLNACDACIIASGTATLEATVLEKPMVVIYKTSWFTWTLGSLIVKIKHVALANIVAGKKVVEELLQTNAKPEKIAQAIEPFLSDPQKTEETRRELKNVKNLLGSSNASLRAAKVVVEELHRK